MKQNKKMTLLLSLSLPFSVSCKGSETYEHEKVLLSKSSVLTSTVLLETKQQLQDVTRYDDCMVFVALEGCEYCARTKEVLKNYIFENHTLIYEVERSVYLEAYEDQTNITGTYANLYPKLSGYPFFCFYSNGKLLDVYNNSILDRKTLDEVLNKSTIETSLSILNDFTYSKLKDSYLIVGSESLEETKSLDTWGYTTELLDKKIAETGKKNILFTWRRCKDCKNYKERIFYKRIVSETEPFYYYECDGYMLLKRQEESPLKELGLNMWSKFCEKYHLSDYSYTDALENKTGFVPSVVSFLNEEYKLSVYANYMNIKRNENGTLSYEKAFYEEITKLTSDTKVEIDDLQSSTYHKAKKELDQKAIKIDDKLNLDFLDLILK